jgi:hypothetical protein
MKSIMSCAARLAQLWVFSLLVAAAASAAPNYSLVWDSSYEHGFPGSEWQSYNNGSWSPSGAMPAGRVSAWTIVDSGSGEPVYDGTHASRGWIVGAASDNHRAYPGIHADDPSNIDDPIETPAVNSFMVWLDADYAAMGSTQWISLGTWANNKNWVVHTLSVRAGKLRLAHTDPFEGEYIGPLPRPDFPRGRWVRITVYIEYNGATGFTQVWQDGVPMLRGDYLGVPGTDLLRAHWGLYAHPSVNYATLYNDDNKIWSLDAPLGDLVSEPLPITAAEPRACGDGAAMALVGGVFYLRRFRRPAV